MSSPVWKIYTRDGEYVAACKDAEDAAALVGLRGDGSTVRYDHKTTVWREGSEECSALDNYDQAAATMHARISEVHARSMARLRDAQASWAARGNR